MKTIFYYILRWNSTKATNLLFNVIVSFAIFFLTCIAVKNGVFENYGDTKACLFSVLMCCVWSGIFNSVALFFSETDYILDELDKFLNVRTYIASNYIIQMFLCFVESIVSTALFFLFFNCNRSGIVFSYSCIDYCITFFLILFSADMLGFFVGMLVRNITTAMTIIPILLITQFLFSGCLFKLNSFLDALSNFTTAKWGYSALGTISNLNSFLPDVAAESIFEYSSGNVIKCWVILFLLELFCCFCAGILLYIRINYMESD